MTTVTLTPWKADYCTGHPQIDAEHQALFDMVGDLHAAIARNAPCRELKERINTLASHTLAHFQHEEALMQQHDYPGLDRHKQTHENLAGKVGQLVRQFDREFAPDERGACITTELTQFLNEWLVHHIRGEDGKMAQFFHQAGIGDRAIP